MKKLLYTLLSILIATGISCKKEYIEPIDIFATEELRDPVNLNLGENSGLDKLMVNSDRIIKTSTGYHVKGTIFSESISGIIPVTSGDFIINTTLPSVSLSKGFGGIEFNGYGTANFPSVGIFSMSQIEEIPGSEVYYNTGQVFKTQSKIDHLQLLNDRYYFRYKVDKGGKGKEYRMKKITVKLREFYLDARDPATLFVGDIYSEKAGVKNLIVEQAAVGISANELWDWAPYKYSDNLEIVTGGTGFVNMNGGISIAGIIPIKKYPLKIFGNAVINTSLTTGGTFDLFERGFDDASFSIGVNGELFFTHELVRFLSDADTVKLGKATLQADFNDESFNIRMAGEYSNDVLERFLGETMMKFIPYNAREGLMYIRGSENPDDFLVYLEEKISLQIPGMGVTPLSECIFKVTKDEVGFSGSIFLPYSIGNVKVTGILHDDGSFILKGVTNCNVDLGSGLIYNADLEVEVTEKGVKLLGAMSFPYGIGEIDVAGGILIDELYFSGKINSSIPFPVNASVNSDLLVSISSKTGIRINGGLFLPGNIGRIEVTGSLSPAELLLTGAINSGMAINFGNVDVRTNAAMSLTASSQSGIILAGNVALPFSLGNASSTIRVTGGGLSMTGNLGSGINISGYPVFNATMSMSATTAGGLYLSGRMKFPGNFGWVSVSGFVRNSGYSLTGDISSSSIDFGPVTLSTDFSMSITNSSGIRTSASGEGCIDTVVFGEICADVDVDVRINYSNNSVELCMSFPEIGRECIGW